MKWYSKASEHGDADAQYKLGYAYSHGEGVPQDHAEAVKWSTRLLSKENPAPSTASALPTTAAKEPLKTVQKQ